jgi:hypothetical protein
MQIWQISAYFNQGVQLIILGRVIVLLFYVWKKIKAHHWLSKIYFKCLAMGNWQPKHWMTSNVFDLDERDVTNGSQLVHAPMQNSKQRCWPTQRIALLPGGALGV